MSVDELAAVESAEELFAWLGQAYDPAVLRVYRVRILKRFGRRLAALGHGGVGSGLHRDSYGELLRRVYDEVMAEVAAGVDTVAPRPPRLYPLRVPPRGRAG